MRSLVGLRLFGPTAKIRLGPYLLGILNCQYTPTNLIKKNMFGTKSEIGERQNHEAQAAA